MNKDNIQQLNGKAMLEFIDTVNHDAQLTSNREVFNGRIMIAKQIKAKI